jgi:hypothetical protein
MCGMRRRRRTRISTPSLRSADLCYITIRAAGRGTLPFAPPRAISICRRKRESLLPPAVRRISPARYRRREGRLTRAHKRSQGLAPSSQDHRSVCEDGIHALSLTTPRTGAPPGSASDASPTPAPDVSRPHRRGAAIIVVSANRYAHVSYGIRNGASACTGQSR